MVWTFQDWPCGLMPTNTTQQHALLFEPLHNILLSFSTPRTTTIKIGCSSSMSTIDKTNGPPSFRMRLLRLRQKGVLFLLMVLPYLVGLVWHGLHPFVSVFTGDDHPRGIYTDENSAEANYFAINHGKFKRRDQLISSQQINKAPLSSLCRAARAVTLADAMNLDRGNLQCRIIDQAVDILQFTPLEGPVVAKSEAIVFVLPAASNWLDSALHTAFLSFLAELLRPHFNWLSKTFIIVAPRIRDGLTLDTTQTVQVFLEAYVGPSHDTDHPPMDELIGRSPKLPMGMSATAVVRQIIVWDQEIVENATKDLKLPTIRLLPQGPRGLLPNMDLLSVARAALQRAVGANAYYAIHPFAEQQRALHRRLDAICNLFTSKPCPAKHTTALLDLLFFEHTLRGHNVTAPHAAALERGIDAVTIQWVTRTTSSRDARMRNAAAKLPSAMEICLRALSNLHERLHHSTALYLLLSMDHFVKHEEYLVPNLLLLIPLIIRAVTLFLVDLEKGLDWQAVGGVVERIVLSIIVISCGMDLIDFVDSHSWWILNDSLSARHAIVGLVYLYLCGLFLLGRISKLSAQARQSVQFVACLWGLYTHLTIAFGHVSLAFPSALLWTPLLAFPHYSDKSNGGMMATLCQGLVVGLVGGLAPFVGLVPMVLPTYTMYVCYAYLPLHMLVSHLWLG